MSDFVNTVDVVGDSALTDSIISRTLVEISDNTFETLSSYAFCGCAVLATANFPVCTHIGSNAFSGCSNLASVSFPVCTSIASSAFANCKSLAVANFPACTNIGRSAFQGCSTLASASFPTCTSIGSNAFQSCRSLATADFFVCMNIGASAFRGCSVLVSVYLGASTVCTLNNSNAFTSTPIASGTGYVYVPASLVDSYKANVRWSYYANQIVAMEE